MSSKQASIQTELSFTTFHNIIDGQRRGAERAVRGVNPATEEELWEAPIATRADLDDAVIAGKRAFVSWSRTSLVERRKCLSKFRDLIERYKDVLSQVIMAETGKTIFQAIIAGNVIICKNSPYSPYAALKFCEIAQEAFPPGVIQILGGSDDMGGWLVEHPEVPMIAFSGHTRTGKKIQEMAAKNLKRLTLLLAGNDPVIVCPDVEDIEKVAKEVALSTWFISGQACIATKRIYVHADIHERFLESLLKATRQTVVGLCANSDAYIGPIQNVDLFRRLKRLEQECETKGYNIVLDGRNRDSAKSPQAVDGGIVNGSFNDCPEKGYFFYPTLVLDPPPDCRLVTEEQFGPIAPYRRWTDVEEVIKEVNSSEYGLGATVYCKSDDRAVELGKRIQAGMVWANCHPRAMGPEPYGGTKHSGFGAEGGEAGLKCFMNPQTMFMFRWSMVKD
ncbi:hypothetical protein J7T55_000221 [Diaporthe amygdali]|uniref:uncharacterized protein n=1 Tax=Phomopsis amygdali TaxID=1214568 RepID=UPI0022FE4EA6|nr:uncharacterized protein J7T55_000221 [Diaporthe amygdali]KAJ0108255.1 hypothetical protein J7T55_000221 [Diaporthe amygdali]